jgi:hypothetical protein
MPIPINPGIGLGAGMGAGAGAFGGAGEALNRIFERIRERNLQAPLPNAQPQQKPAEQKPRQQDPFRVPRINSRPQPIPKTIPTQTSGTAGPTGSSFDRENLKTTFNDMREAASRLKREVIENPNKFTPLERQRILKEAQDIEEDLSDTHVTFELYGRTIAGVPKSFLYVTNKLETLIKANEKFKEETGKYSSIINQLIAQVKADQEAMRVEVETGVPTKPPRRTSFEGESFKTVPKAPTTTSFPEAEPIPEPEPTAEPTPQGIPLFGEQGEAKYKAPPRKTNFEGETFGRVPKRPPSSTAEPTQAPRTVFEGESFGRVPKRPPSSTIKPIPFTARQEPVVNQGDSGAPNPQTPKKSWSDWFFKRNPKQTPDPTPTPSPTSTPKPTPSPSPEPSPTPSPSPSPEPSREKSFEEIMKEHWAKEDAEKEKERKKKHKWWLLSAGLSAAGILYGIYTGNQRQKELKEHLAKMEEKEKEFLKELHGAADGSEEKADAQKKLDDLRNNEMNKIKAELLKEAVKSMKSDNDNRKNKDRNVGYFMRQFGKSLRGGRANDHYHAIQESTPSYNLRKFMQGLNAR